MPPSPSRAPAERRARRQVPGIKTMMIGERERERERERESAERSGNKRSCSDQNKTLRAHQAILVLVHPPVCVVHPRQTNPGNKTQQQNNPPGVKSSRSKPVAAHLAADIKQSRLIQSPRIQNQKRSATSERSPPRAVRSLAWQCIEQQIDAT